MIFKFFYQNHVEIFLILDKGHTVGQEMLKSDIKKKISLNYTILGIGLNNIQQQKTEIYFTFLRIIGHCASLLNPGNRIKV